MLSHSTTLLLLALTLTTAACAAEPADDAMSADSASTSAPAIHGHTVKTLGAVFGRPVQGIATEAEARATEPKVRDDARQSALDQCAATLALPRSAISTKLIGLASNVTKDASDGRFVVTAATTQTYCSSASLDDAVVVTLEDQLHAAATLRAGGKILLDPRLDRVVDDVSVLGHIAATRPHLMARFDGGAFHEVTGLSGLDAKKGGLVDVQLPFAEDALLLDVTSAADRFEIFFRVERWNVTGFFEDGNFTGTLVTRAPDAFVSNFGANYRLPVAK